MKTWGNYTYTSLADEEKAMNNVIGQMVGDSYQWRCPGCNDVIIDDFVPDSGRCKRCAMDSGFCPSCASCKEPCGRTPPQSQVDTWEPDHRFEPKLVAPPGPNALRYNSGKVDYTLIPVEAQTGEAAVWAKGAIKYGRNNFRKYWGDDTYSVVLASLLRHVMAVQRGELRDPETGEYHMSHVRANAAMLICYEEDRPTSNISHTTKSNK